MADLTTRYLGLTLPTPLVVSSNPLNRSIDNIRQMADAGAGAIILPSLFEEQLRAEDMGGAQRQVLPEPLQNILDIEKYNMGVNNYLAHIFQARKAVDIPIIASLNGSADGSWVRYARFLEAAGAAALELNLYYLPTKTYVSGADMEQAYLTLVKRVRDTVQIPIAVKLFPYISSLPHFANQLVEAGANGLVLFNRFYQPDYDLDTLTIEPALTLSDSAELRLRLRWVAILYKRIQSSLAITGGVQNGQDVIKALLSGADVAMTASALLRHGAGYVGRIIEEVNSWLDAKGHSSVDDIRGLLSLQVTQNRDALERANYIQVLQSYDPSSTPQND
jgi:dihydroorotate dehydrogenase (fumarate)